MDSFKHGFESALTKHFLFKSKVKAYVHGADTPLEPIVDFHACHFGIWIAEKGLQQFGHILKIREPGQVPEEIFAHARHLVNLKNAGADEAAITGLTKLEQIAERIRELLQVIQPKAQ